MIISNMGKITLVGSPEIIGGELLHAIDAVIQAENDDDVTIICEMVHCAKEVDMLSVLKEFANRVSKNL